MKIGKISGDFGKNLEKILVKLANLLTYSRKDFEELRADVERVDFLSHLDKKKISKIVMKFFHNFFKISRNLL